MPDRYFTKSYKSPKPFLLGLTLVVFSWAGTSSHASPLSAGNILVSGFGNGVLSEYTATGSLVQSFVVPDVDGDGFRDLRDIAVDSTGKVQMFNGTFSPVLTTLDPTTGTFQHHTFSGWTTVNNVSFGGIATAGNFAFVTDMRTFGHGGVDEAKGIVRFNLTDFSGTRFATNDGYQDLTLGRDGLLYALPGEGTPAANIDVFNPASLAFIRSITLPVNLFLADIRGIAVDADGTIYAAGWDGKLYKISAAGSFLSSVITGTSNLSDIDLSEGNQLLTAGRFGEIIRTTTNFDNLSLVTSVNDTAHVAFVGAVPEPSSWVLLMSGLLALAYVRKRRLNLR